MVAALQRLTRNLDHLEVRHVTVPPGATLVTLDDSPQRRFQPLGAILQASTSDRVGADVKVAFQITFGLLGALTLGLEFCPSPITFFLSDDSIAVSAVEVISLDLEFCGQ